LADVLPALAKPQVLEGFADDGTPLLRPARGAITLRQVLSHSAGYGYDTWNREIAQYLKQTGLPRVPTSAAQLEATPLLFDPGTSWNYGINTDVAGLAVEASSGKRLDFALTEGILGALGMADTTVVLRDDQRARLVTTRQRAAGGALSDIGFVMDRGVSYCLGGGALHGTGRDYLRFVRMILNDGMHEGERLLSRAAIAAMSSNQLAPGVRVRRLVSANPPRSADAEFFPGMEKQWSTAFMITTGTAPTGRRPGSLAWAGIANTYCWIDPAAGVGGVFMSQLLPFADPAVLAAFAAFETAAYAGFRPR
jgi:CubicO group peptidase (beta-lactamase class C family)